jgi:hypothetical protein
MKIKQIELGEHESIEILHKSVRVRITVTYVDAVFEGEVETEIVPRNVGLQHKVIAREGTFLQTVGGVVVRTKPTRDKL